MADEAFFEGSGEEFGITESVAAAESFPERFRIKSTGIRTAAPIRERTPFKGKRTDIFHTNTLATKAIPQIVAARSRQRNFHEAISVES